MKKIMLIALAGFVGGTLGLSARAADLTTYTWVGGTQGNFEDAANWDPQGVPNGNTTALLFTNGVTVTLKTGITNAKVTVTKGSVYFNTTTASMRYRGGTSDGSSVVYDIAKGAAFYPVYSGWTCYNAYNCDVVKIGGGSLVFYAATGESASDCVGSFDVREGTLTAGMMYGSCYVKETITVRSGATFNGKPWYNTPTTIQSPTRIIVEKGGLLDYNTQGTFCSVSGAGTIKNSGTFVVTLRNTGTDGFSGDLIGAFKIEPTNGEPFLIAGTNTLMKLTPTIVEPAAPATALAFAPGIVYAVTDPTPYAAYTKDTAGNALYFCKTVASGTTYTHTAAGDDTWPANCILNGSGDICEKSAGTWTISNYCQSGGAFYLHPAAAGTNLVFAGGTSTNVSATGFVDRAFGTPYRVDFTGGDHHFKSYLSGEANLTYLQTAGTVWAWPLLGTFSNGSQVCSSNEIFYTMTGGTLYSETSSRACYGLGLEVGGTATAYLRKGSNGRHKIAFGRGHTVRVKDSGRLSVDHLNFMYYSGGAPARLELLGGRMEVSEFLGCENVASGAIGKSTARVLFNGGKIYLGPNMTTVSSSSLTDDQFRTAFGPKGGEIEVVRTYDNSNGLNWFGPIEAAEGADDGGFVKSGLGMLQFYRNVELTGPITIRSGLLRNAVSAPTTPFGTGSVTVEYGTLSTSATGGDVTAASGSGSALVFAGGGTVQTGSRKLTVGGLRRADHGVLFAKAENAALKSGNRFVVTGGVANDATTGLAAQPVYSFSSIVYGNGYGARGGGMIGFLTYDADAGFKSAATVADIPADATGASVCEVTNGLFTLTRDATVGALNVWAPIGKSKTGGLTIQSGCTLTIGNGAGTIAPLVLNNTAMVCAQGEGNGGCEVQGGTIAFGAAEAQILVNATWRNFIHYDSGTLSSRLTGSGDLVIASPWLFESRYLPRAIDITGDNALAGETWIKGVSVRIRAPTGLGAGTVHVDGNDWFGGRLVLRSDFTGAAFAGAIELSGYGPTIPSGLLSTETVGTGDFRTSEDGALAVLKTVSLTGGVTAKTNTCVMVGGGAVATVDSVLSGPGQLTVKGPGTLRLTKANTISGGIVVKSGATIEFAGAGSYGTGSLTVEKGAVLRFADRASVPSGFVWEGDCVVEFGAAPTGDDDFVKEGDNTAVLLETGDYAGETRVEGGTLCLGYPTPSELPYADSITFRFDASDATTLTCDGESGAVSAWADADGRATVFAQAEASRQPVYDADAFGGLGAVHFPGTAAQQLTNSVKRSFQSVVAVLTAGDETGVHPKNASNQGTWNYAPLIGLYGLNMCDLAIRMPTTMIGSAPSWAYESLASGAEIDVDGVATNGFAFGKPSVAGFSLAARVASLPLALGESYGWPSYNYSFYGDIGEIVAYDKVLSEEDRRGVENYLMAKWGLAPETPVVRNMLPSSTDLTVAEGATLDLAGTYQQVATMDLSGAIVNSGSATLAVLRLEKGTSYVRGGSLGENIELQVRAGAVLDLGGGTLTVDWVRCLADRANIVNGTLVVRKGYRAPYGSGFIIFLR